MQKLVDLNFKGTENLTDSKGNLTAGALARESDATYVDSDGVLQTSWGDRDQLIAAAAQNDITTWWGLTNAGNSTANAIVADTNVAAHTVSKVALSDAGTYVFSAEMKQGAVPEVRMSLGDDSGSASSLAFFSLSTGAVLETTNAISSISSVGDGWYLCSIASTLDSGADWVQIYAVALNKDITFAGDNSTPSTYIRNIMLEELPSGNVIGDDLFDQETLGVAVIDDDCADDDTGDWLITDSTLTFDTDYYEIEVTATDTVYIRQADVLTPGTVYKISLDYYIPLSNTNVDELNVRSFSSEDTNIIDSLTVTDSWTSATGFYLCDNDPLNDNIYLYLMQSGSADGLNIEIGRAHV